MNGVTEKKSDRDKKIAAVLEKYSDSAAITANLPTDGIDNYFMRAALELASLAVSDGEVPVGCVIVRDGAIIAGDYNGRETFRDALYHAESSAIAKASEKLGGWRLVGCTLYVTLEPCPMCAGACWASRVPRVVIGAKDARAGAMGSLINLNSYPLNHKPSVTFGVLEDECRTILHNFFTSRRREKNTKNPTNSAKMKKKTLFISDLDGTLLDSDASLPKESADKLNRLAKDGVMITYATARTIRSVMHILGDIDFSNDSCQPIALMNGVLIRDMKSGKYVSSAVISQKNAVKIISAFEKIGAEPFVYTIDNNDTIDGDPLHTYYREITNTPMQKFLDERVIRYKKPFVKLQSLHEIETQDIVYFCVLGDETLVKKSYDAIDGITGIKYAFYRDSYDTDTWYLEVFSDSASKAHAVEFLRKYTNADEIICFGDNLNDLPMFEKADVRVAVTGAVDEIKKSADYITSSVPDFINEYVTQNGVKK